MSIPRRIFTAALGAPLTQMLADFRQQLWEEWRLWRSHRRGLAKARTLVGGGPLCLHLGCGHVYKAGWVNIDSYFLPPCTPDVTLDLRHPLPFPDGSCAKIYSEHFFEHIPFPAGAVANLQESFRVLAPGGLLSLGVPDPVPVLQAYLAGTSDAYFDYFEKHFSVRRHLGTRMEALNWLFRQGGEHQFIYDFLSLEKMLLAAGFARIARRDYDPARDSEPRRAETIYVDAMKPL